MTRPPYRLDRTVLIHAEPETVFRYFRTTDGQGRARGTNVFVIGPRGLFESVTDFWSAHPRA